MTSSSNSSSRVGSWLGDFPAIFPPLPPVRWHNFHGVFFLKLGDTVGEVKIISYVSLVWCLINFGFCMANSLSTWGVLALPLPSPFAREFVLNIPLHTVGPSIILFRWNENNLETVVS